MLGDTLYLCGIDSILRQYLTHDEVELTLNECQCRAYGGHLSGLATDQKILHASLFWPLIFKDCIDAIKKCPSF